ncbi:MAG: hypothetical protein Kow0074_04880 [Candidatus Zixiibacteriota bacterium]
MNWPNHERPCAWIGERLEAFLDGDLPPEETSVIESHLSQCRDCAHELSMAQRVSRSLRSLPAMACPDEVIEAVRRRTNAPHRSWLQRWRDAWRQPVLVGTAAAVMVILIAVLGIQWHQPSEVSAEEIEMAEIETRWAIAKVRQVGRKATMTLRDEVLDNRVAVPIRRSVLNSIRIKTGKMYEEENNAG